MSILFLSLHPDKGQSIPHNTKHLGAVVKAFPRFLRTFIRLKFSALTPEKEQLTLDSSKNINVYFAPCEPDDKNGLKSVLEHLLLGARRSIYCAVYDLEDSDIAEILINKHKAGTLVRIVSDGDYFKREAVRTCMKAGIPVVFDTRQAFMHDKFCVVDDEYVWTGSTNFTRNCFYHNDNNSVLIKSPMLASDYILEFDEMFFDAKFGPRSPCNTSGKIVTFQDAAVRCYFAPEDKIEDKIASEIRKTDKAIWVMAFSFTSYDLANELGRLSQRGVDVQVLLEKRNAATNESKDRYLISKGAKVYYDGNPDSMHHKVMVLDSVKVVTGSYNFSRAAEKENDENVLIIESSQVAQKYVEEFHRLIRSAKIVRENN
ncbi:MAG TPA: phospholipase D-like domain-containing protein [Candidatus Hydrogenedentes bacterium]|nr:phospholipase D-like domain-containing protein [Candidatus Hydrogenedentota bacterium]